MNLPGRTQRIGIGEFADPRGILPRFFARLDYWAALEAECPELVAKLAPIWAPAVEAIGALRDEVRCQAAAEETALVPTIAPHVAEAVAARFEDVLGVPLARDPGTPIKRPVMYPLPPADSPAVIAATAALRSASARHARWMSDAGFPRDDLGWCFITAVMGIVANLDRLDAAPTISSSIEDDGTNAEAALRDPGVTTAPPSLVPESHLPPDPAPTMALLDSDRMNKFMSWLMSWFEQWPKTDDPAELVSWLADQLVPVLGPAIAISVPKLQWNPRVETRAAAEARLRAAAERAIREHLDATMATLTAEGAVPTPQKTTGLEHFRWLVKYQVKGQSHRAIARQVYRERQAVRAAIKETADLVGLPLRPAGRPGRPRKT